MNTENNDHQSTVTDILESRFGKSLEGASLEDKLSLLEATACSLRVDMTFASALEIVCSMDDSTLESVSLLDMDDSVDFENVNEGLRIMALLTEGIAEDYSVLAAKERLAD
ncbi:MULTISPECIES: hypothetical protein [unclassified Microcoleus]|uniref:hypothetical protein n=1 Tax=unclassified Microcoleus TaxID=2642155 RepID=UPI001D451BA6|nr:MULTISPECIES: hypothetical protein [unclassified Microcoleus]MCC3503042.1 hypothetical protein [Microcoleus sp. PH2017_19_SFW_U_A]TAG58473.1 MAG: hypothetical protein EAZ28_14615 [Oscillatoriales cyanobacterium]MCC3523542.1 hypothetical protein [Microcoleus sp. PH2017_20_SFW_D_A]MCC3554187.1 hypothetical protein [Microcoleus sp. PH2017_35_SFW_U_B]MCC3565977.1 hypothetical protein [Microcoleus sp. PH2017_31_RDM_U_A]